MFERYTEKARRVIFFARYEASEVGSSYIESEHLLIGLLRESGPALRKHMGGAVSMEELRAEITAATLRRAPTSSSVDLPLSNECKRILAYAAEEAMRLRHEHIGTEHLMLGTLREKECFAAGLLRGRGMSLETARRSVEADARQVGGSSASGIGSGSSSGDAREAVRGSNLRCRDFGDAVDLGRLDFSPENRREYPHQLGSQYGGVIPGIGCCLGVHSRQRRLATAASRGQGRERRRHRRQRAIVRPWAGRGVFEFGLLGPEWSRKKRSRSAVVLLPGFVHFAHVKQCLQVVGL
jgi:hypothetical protein